MASALGDSIVAFAPISVIQGVLSNAKRRLDRRWVGAALGATVLVVLFNNSIGPQLRLINLIAPSPIAIGLFVHGGLVTWRHPGQGGAQRLAPAGFGAAVLRGAVEPACRHAAERFPHRAPPTRSAPNSPST